MSEIQLFYDDQNIFITGGTGYFGKILIEKLLRSFPNIGTIYMLMRPKRGKDVNERRKELLRAPVFDPLRQKNPDFEQKVVAINGDIEKPGLGLSAEDRNFLIKEVSIVFHSAASVVFNEPLPKAFVTNIMSVKEIIDFCKECKKLKAAVYVSSAFSNLIHDKIEEKVYPSPIKYEEIKAITEFMKEKNLSREDQQKLTKIIIGKFPNTYTFSKATGEGLIKEYASDLSFCIYRFSIGTSTYKEPFPGWIDASQGMNALLIYGKLGTVHVLNLNEKINFDIIPADFAVNGIIASCWETGMIPKKIDGDVPVYNFVSSTDNPIKMGDVFEIYKKYQWKNPARAAIYYPFFIGVTSLPLFIIYNFFLHKIPIFIGDLILKLLGRNPNLHRIYQKGVVVMDSLRIFMNRDWIFETYRIRALWNKLSETDKKLLPFDITTVNWDDFTNIHFDAVHKFLLKTDNSPESIKYSRRRMMKHSKKLDVKAEKHKK
ncbi:fatty acyl-CoA reductase wat-like isoform X2 [Belonocnema kinseyi]|uniref:fatty acyl-CoA reductase wat-like isoform X2 n=1 Tax=Belonocnema kinseyi TaxID=2817044 RepID=UPI00143DB82A|nr:fatty acyl-CoA reductase wat-like isoform X2 [Belonocnema kinseyi]